MGSKEEDECYWGPTAQIHKPDVKDVMDMYVPNRINFLALSHFLGITYFVILAILSALELSGYNVASTNTFVWMWAGMVFYHLLWAIALIHYRYQQYDVNVFHYFKVESPFWGNLILSCTILALFWSFQRTHNQAVITSTGFTFNILALFKMRAFNGPYSTLGQQAVNYMQLANSQWLVINGVVVATLVIMLFVSGDAIVHHITRKTLPYKYKEPDSGNSEVHHYGHKVSKKDVNGRYGGGYDSTYEKGVNKRKTRMHS